MDNLSWQVATTRTEVWDVVVLGGGPAGALAARQLAQQGLTVLLAEKHRLPRAKVCGGCLGGAALEILDRVGLGQLPTRCGGTALRTMRLASNGRTADFPVGRRVAVSRERFDKLLIDDAASAGATVCDQTSGSLPLAAESESRPVVLHRLGESRTVRARIALVATGLSTSPIGFESVTTPHSLVGLGATLTGSFPSAESDVLTMACSREGYVGVACVGPGEWDVAAAVDPRALASAGSPAALVCRILASAGLPSPDELNQAAWRGTPPLTRSTRPLAGHRCLLIGDAAGYVEPFTGEGIGWAMQSAVDASELVSTHLHGWNASVAANWTRRYERALARRQRTCRTTSSLLRSGVARSIAIWAVHRAPRLAGPLIRQLDRPMATVAADATEQADGG